MMVKSRDETSERPRDEKTPLCDVCKKPISRDRIRLYPWSKTCSKKCSRKASLEGRRIRAIEIAEEKKKREEHQKNMIAPKPKNVSRMKKRERNVVLFIFGSHSITDEGLIFHQLDRYINKMFKADVKWKIISIIIYNDYHDCIYKYIERYAIKRGHGFVPLSSPWFEGRSTSRIRKFRDWMMLNACTHAICFWDGSDAESLNTIRQCKFYKKPIRTYNIKDDTFEDYIPKKDEED